MSETGASLSISSATYSEPEAFSRAMLKSLYADPLSPEATNLGVRRLIPIYFERAVKPSFPRRREPTPWPHIYGGITVTWYYSTLLEQLSESLATSHLSVLGVPTSLQVDPGTYHRTPPNSPLFHSCPRRYFSSQRTSSAPSSRLMTVWPSCFSQTTTESGRSDRASTRTSE